MSYDLHVSCSCAQLFEHGLARRPCPIVCSLPALLKRRGAQHRHLFKPFAHLHQLLGRVKTQLAHLPNGARSALHPQGGGQSRDLGAAPLLLVFPV